MTAVIPLLFGLASAFVFYFITTRKLKPFTRITLDTVFSFFTLFALYVLEFFVTDGNVQSYIFFLFSLSFFVTLSFIFPPKNKKKD